MAITRSRSFGGRRNQSKGNDMTGYQSKKKAAQDKLAHLTSEEGTADLEALIKEALAQPPQQEPEQEPVGKFAKFTDNIWREVTDGSAGVPLYTIPSQRPWVGLTDEEMSDIEDASEMMIGIVAFSLISDTLKANNT